MGTLSVEQFVSQMLSTAAELSKGPRKPLLSATQAATKVEKQFMAGAVGADFRMGKMRVGVRYDSLAGGAAMIVKATGPAHLIERDTSAHFIAPKRKRGGRTRKGNASFLGGMQMLAALTGGTGGIGGGLSRVGRTGVSGQPNQTGWAMYARHPGTSGKHPFERGMKPAGQAGLTAYYKALIADMRKGF